jgi:arginine-tRNA-protein transferase
MTELFRMVEKPRTCSYLPNEKASLEIRVVKDMGEGEYGALLERGWRRFGWQFFKPGCPQCRECRSIRVLAQEFKASAGQRRVLRKNEAVRAELHSLFVLRETVDLYNRYQLFMHEQRGWELQHASASSFQDMFLSGPSPLGRQWLYFDDDRLIGVAMMDEIPRQCVSLVYFFHDPEWRAQSPGVFSVLTQIEYARREGMPHAYLGYWIKDCGSMNYKNRFAPYEILDDYVNEGESPIWRRT